MRRMRRESRIAGLAGLAGMIIVDSVLRAFEER